ncbi:hypothetical protein COO91_02797 [Nostoc flagelliforme CCNUN1]|uniref:Uncharacterized protein n=1 Tax=Nostoc flagelliforme CCNUN1 TaxID=2038116 RepID=A0A2K8SN45_9NOSO|nr:hypothetical protein COO91_02797 [Nostoc flagelliforme CCNUN1]
MLNKRNHLSARTLFITNLQFLDSRRIWLNYINIIGAIAENC